MTEQPRAQLAKVFESLDELPSPARYQRALERIDCLPDESWALESVRLAVLSSFTFDPLLPLLRVEAARRAIAAEVHLGDYNVIDQEILDGGSRLYEFNPDVLLLAIRLEEYSPRLAHEFLDLEDGSAELLAEELVERLRGLIGRFRELSSAGILLHNFAFPPRSPLGILEGMRADSQRQVLWRLNSRLAELAAETPGVYVFDYAGLVMAEGSRHWQDDKMWHLARIPVAGDRLQSLARAYVRVLSPVLGLTRKCLVLDLDNTLWGGVVGEEGLGGIAIGQTYPGTAYLEFQRYVMDLHRRGVILAVNSKNNLEDAKAVFTSHTDMLLGWEHFSAFRINWRDKVTNMTELAQELDLGLDSFVFFDDSPAEREYMRRELPEVLTIEVPSSPIEFARVLEESGAFESLSYTEEDRRRGELYRAQAERKSFAARTPSLESFYLGLRMEAQIRPVDRETLSRTAQLIAKTNQFNLTTRRHTEAALKEFMESPDYRLYCLRLKDKFGDNGWVGVSILRRAEDARWWLDTFLLSCRVIGRTVETAFLAFLLGEVRRLGGEEAWGEFLPTRKNAPAADFFERHGAECLTREESRTVWRLSTAPLSFKPPACIAVAGTPSPGR